MRHPRPMPYAIGVGAGIMAGAATYALATGSPLQGSIYAGVAVMAVTHSLVDAIHTTEGGGE